MTVPILLDLQIELGNGENLIDVINEQKDSIDECLRILRLVQRGLGDFFGQNRVLFSAETLKPRSRKTTIFKAEVSFTLTVASGLELKFRDYQVLCTVWPGQSRWEVIVYDCKLVDRRKIAYNKQDEDLAKTICAMVIELEEILPPSLIGGSTREGVRR